MAKKKNSNAAFVVGSMLGAVAGAGFALWRTPMSGKELRSKLTPGPVSSGSTTQSKPGTSFTDKLIGMAEKATAPIVGVELGKTANGTGTPVVSAPIVPDTETDIVADGAVNVASETIMPTGTYAAPAAAKETPRFGWGDPAPVAQTEVKESTMVVNEHADQPVPVGKEAPQAEAAQPSSTDPAQSAQPYAAPDDSYGNVSIRAKRFTWGDPAPEVSAADLDPEATTGKDATAVNNLNQEPTLSAPATAGDYAAPEVEKRMIRELREGSTETTAAIPADEATAVTVEHMLAQSQDAPVLSAPAKMHKFPKLGGLE